MVKQGMLVITEVGHEIGMVIVISEISAVFPFDSQLKSQQSSFGLCLTAKHGGLQP